MRPFYFDDLEDLFPIIHCKCQESSERWLVFVEKKQKGIDLKEQLQNAGISSAFVSAETNTGSVRSDAYKKLKRIEQESGFFLH